MAYSNASSPEVVTTNAPPLRNYDGAPLSCTPFSDSINVSFMAWPVTSGITSARKGRYKVQATPQGGGTPVVAEGAGLLSNDGSNWATTVVSIPGLTPSTQYLVVAYFDNNAS